MMNITYTFLFSYPFGYNLLNYGMPVLQQSYKEFSLDIKKGEIPKNLILSSKYKIITNIILKNITEKFLEGEKISDDNLRYYYADEKTFEDMMGESVNTGFFSAKKVLIYKNYKKLLKAERELFLRYLNDYNPDTLIIFHSNDFADIKDNLIEHGSIKTISIKDFSEAELFNWLKEIFESYQISDEDINYFISLSGGSVDELYNEAEKVKIYAYETKAITKEIIKLCAGISKDFDENDFLMAVVGKDFDGAIKIYDKLALQKDIEIFLIYMIGNAFMGIAKLFDPQINQYSGKIKITLKLWFASDKLIETLKTYKESTDLGTVRGHLQRIFEVDKQLKSSSPDKKNVITNLIFSLTNS